MPELTRAKAKKLARIAAMQAEKRRLQAQREAAAQRDLLANYLPFKSFHRSGLSATMEGLHGEDLCDADIEAMMTLQRTNLGITKDSGNFDSESSRAALVHKESRILLIRPVPKQEQEADSAPEQDLPAAEDEWDFLPEVAHLVQSRAGALAPAVAEIDPAEIDPAGEPSPARAQEPGESAEPPILGYLHLQFCVSDGPPLLCVLNMQLLPQATGKGLGKFALQLVEVRSSKQHSHVMQFRCPEIRCTSAFSYPAERQSPLLLAFTAHGTSASDGARDALRQGRHGDHHASIQAPPCGRRHGARGRIQQHGLAHLCDLPEP